MYRELPQYAENFSCEIHSSKPKRLPNFGKENSLGEKRDLVCSFKDVHTPLTFLTMSTSPTPHTRHAHSPHSSHCPLLTHLTLVMHTVLTPHTVHTPGRVHIHMSDLPNGTEDDQWHHLVGGGTKTAKVSVRLVANFKDYAILPIEEYRSLKEVHYCD